MSPGEELHRQYMRDQPPGVIPCRWDDRPTWYRQRWAFLAQLPTEEALACAKLKHQRMQKVADNWKWDLGDMDACGEQLKLRIRQEFER